VYLWTGISGKKQIQKQINELSVVPILNEQLKIIGFLTT